jgi:flagellar secretion chaperone FliS
MLQSAAARYEQVKASTMSKGELLLALYDGLFRFLNGAKMCFDSGSLSKGRELCSKARAILSELQIALDPSVAPELCNNLSALYTFCLDRVRQASVAGESAPLADVTRVLAPLKEAWEKAVPEAAREGICPRGA